MILIVISMNFTEKDAANGEHSGSFASQSENTNRCSLRLQQPLQGLAHKHPPGHQGTLK
jgi:hypothetical protein